MLEIQNAEKFLKDMGWTKLDDDMWYHDKATRKGQNYTLTTEEAIDFEFERML